MITLEVAGATLIFKLSFFFHIIPGPNWVNVGERKCEILTELLAGSKPESN